MSIILIFEFLFFHFLFWYCHDSIHLNLCIQRKFCRLKGAPRRRIMGKILCIHTVKPRKITKGRVVNTIKLAIQGCNMLGVRNPHIAVAGLNPHAGESGVIGKEEGRAIVPAIEDMKMKPKQP